jgi:hypothetical protein
MAKAKADVSTKASDPKAVDAYMAKLKHPMLEVAAGLRGIILKTSPDIGEEIKWNAPAFFYTGKMQAFDPKEYKRYLIVFNFFKKDCLRLVFWGGDKAKDKSGFLQGDYPDGRRLALLHGMDEVKARKKDLQNALKNQLKAIDE